MYALEACLQEQQLTLPDSDISDDSAYVPCQSSMRHRQAALRKLIERVDVALAVPGDQVLEMGSYNQPEAELQSVFNRHWFHGGIMIVGAAIVTALTVYYLPSGLLPFRVSVI